MKVFILCNSTGYKGAQLSDSFGRLRTDRIIRVHIGCTNNPFLADDVPRGYRQSVFRFIVKPVQGAIERLVQVSQVIRQHKDKPKLLCRLQMEIRQDVEAQVQLPMDIARVPVEFRSERHDAPTECSNLGIYLL